MSSFFTFPPHTLPQSFSMWTSEDRQCTGSLLLSSLLQLDLCTISPALYFLYTVLLERGREGGESWGWVYACGRRGSGVGGYRGCWGREARIAEADDFFLWPSRILNDSAAGRSWGCTLFRMIYLYMCSQLPCIDLARPDSGSRNKAGRQTEVLLEPIQSYQI